MNGTPFGRYLLIGSLGRGGMGEVFRAFDTAMEREVALKVLHPGVANDEVFQERFRREAQTAASLDEPHVVPIYDYGEIDGRLYVTMRLIRGRDLEAIIAEGPMRPARAVDIVEQVASALDAAHLRGLVHRDIKPSNVMVGDGDFAYLIDFGIARAVDGSKLTSTGSVIGTWAYMSPERLNTGRAEKSADIYALTCVLFETLTGRRPYSGDSLEQQVVGHLATPVPRPCALVPDLPAGFDEVIRTGMAKDPDERFRTTKELGEAARAALDGSLGPRATTRVGAVDSKTHLAPAAVQHTATLLASDAVDGATRYAAGVDSRRGMESQLPTTSAATIAASTRTGHRRRRSIIIAVAALLALVGGLTGYRLMASAPPSGDGVLPFTELITPRGIAVDGVGTVYVADANFQANRIARLAAGSEHQDVLPVPGLNQPQGVAVDVSGNLAVVADTGNNRLVRVAVGSSTARELRIDGLDAPCYVAIDHIGTVYVTDLVGVLRVPPDSDIPDRVPFAGSISPRGLAVDNFGNVFVVDGASEQVLKMSPDGVQDRLPFNDLSKPRAVAVDSEGSIYVIDGSQERRVVKLSAGSASQTVLPFEGLTVAEDLAVDLSGRVYVVNSGDNARVLVLEQH